MLAFLVAKIFLTKHNVSYIINDIVNKCYFEVIMLKIFVEKYNNLSDEELITKIRNNDQEAFEALFIRYFSRISYLVSKNCKAESEKEDMFQDATISFYYATQMYDFHSSSFATFLTICIERSFNSTIKKATAQKRIPKEMLVFIDDNVAEEIKVVSAEEEFFDKNSVAETKIDILSKLSKMEVSVLKSFLKTGSYDETAKELSISRKAVDNALVRIRKKLTVS